MKYDVIIIGSGISGLTAATLLAKEGRSVLVVEGHPRPGGSIRSFMRKGLRFEIGCHYTGCLGEGEVLNRLWHHCGVLQGIEAVSRGDSCDTLHFRDGTPPLHAWYDYRRFADGLKARFPRECDGIQRFLAALRESSAEIPFYNLELPLTPFLREYRPQRRPLQPFLHSLVKNPELRHALTVLTMLYGVPVADADLAGHALVCHGYYTGAWTLAGGGQSLVDAFLHRLSALGVELQCGCRAEALCVDGGRLSGVRLADGGESACDQVIFTGHPAGVVEMVPPGVFRPAYRNRLQGLRNTISFFALFARSRSLLPAGLNHFCLDRNRELYPRPDSQPGDFRPLLLTGGDSLQDGENSIILLRPCRWGEVVEFMTKRKSSGYRELKRRYTEATLADAAACMGSAMPELEVLATASPLTFHDDLAAPQGAPYGAMHCLGQYTPDTRTRLPGLYLAGQSTLMTGMVGASVSAIAAAGEIVGLEQLWDKIRL